MRTTIELKDEHRARLLEIAARRGEKGFSAVVAEAIERFLAEEKERGETRRRAVGAFGSLDAEDGAQLDREVRRLREHWR